VPLAALLAALVAGGVWFARQRAAESASRARLAELETLFEESDFVAVWKLARELEGRLGDDRELERLRLASTIPVTIESVPPGAQVAFRGYLERPDAWKPLGATPLESLRLPDTALLFRVEKAGFDAVEGLPFQETSEVSHLVRFELTPAGTARLGMVRIPAGQGGYPRATFDLAPFWIGRHEVTNAEYLRFVEAGGYRDRALWTSPFVRDGAQIPFDEAMARFVDRTGRPGPASWELGTFPEGRAEHPVAGVSWYEAMAYARWSDAELPTLHHWLRAASPDLFSEILQVSNFDAEDTVAVGSRHGTGAYGTEDMAGNVFEWTSSHDATGRAYLVGGAWNEPSYTFNEPGPVPPFDRSPNRGLRLARYEGELSPALRAPVEEGDDRLSWVPVDDRVFEAYRSFYAYTKSDLHPAVDAVDDASPHYRWEKVSFDAAYGGERIPAHLLLPKNARPPFQVVVYFPPSPAEKFASSQTLDGLPWFEFLVRSGRAVLFPIYKNTYERRIPGWRRTPESRRDVVLQWSKDLGRAIDYLETRTDIDRARIAFYGFSLGATHGTILTALEPRIRANVFLGGGIQPAAYLPEAYAVNFAPRVEAPTLMITGRDDFVRPVKAYQEPLFRLLGVPEDRKKLAQLDGGHVPTDRNGLIREVLAWLDRWLGPVDTKAP
jgi:formylglycine-generating enzyme required for sulfatase activity